MNALNMLKDIISQLTGVLMSVLVLGVVAGVVFGGNVPFVGGVLDGVLGLVNSLGSNGLVGLLVAGWLMTKVE
ncbi:hypothetical protein N9284_02515 [Halieaceae bacterium]|jgi:hypothetical protein|nr:hypothetical protein [Halieaceae bacterium]